jgi:hypothetical protein
LWGRIGEPGEFFTLSAESVRQLSWRDCHMHRPLPAENRPEDRTWKWCDQGSAGCAAHEAAALLRATVGGLENEFGPAIPQPLPDFFESRNGLPGAAGQTEEFSYAALQSCPDLGFEIGRDVHRAARSS